MKRIKNIIIKKKRALILVFILFCICILAGCGKDKLEAEGIKAGEEETSFKCEVGKAGDKMPVTRAMAAKMAALYFYDENKINAFDRQITFDDVEEDKWYDKYVNAAFISGCMKGIDEKSFKPEDYVTLYQAQAIADRMNTENKVKIKLTDENKDKPISLALWNELYVKVFESEENSGIELKSIIPVATSQTSASIKAGYVITDSGLYKAYGLNIDDIIGTKLNAIVKGSSILSVDEITETEPIIENVLATGNSDKSQEIFIGGMKKSFSLGDNVQPIDGGVICDVKISNDTITYSQEINDRINSKILMADDEKIELESTGDIFRDKDFKVYSFNEGEARLKTLSELICGEEYDFYIRDGRLCAAVIDESKSHNNNKIRVLINNNEGKNINGMVSLSSTGDFHIITGKDERKYKAEEEIIIDKGENEDLFSKSRIKAETENEEDYIIIKSVKTDNGEGFLKVKGNVEISQAENGYIIVNETNIEDYTYGVLNGIGTEEYNDETIKVLAVAARSRAYKQKQDNALLAYGANVDRTSAYQPYMPEIENVKNKNAAEETRGMCIMYDGSFTAPNYFSCDGGSSAAMGQVWFDSKSLEFPFDAGEYNKAEIFLKGYGDLSNEDSFKNFIDKEEPQDSMKWFRWSFKMNKDEITACVNASLKWLYKAYPEFVKCLDKSGSFISKEVEDVGEVKNIEITERGTGGNVMEMKITGSKEIVILRSDNIVRKIIKPKQFVYGRNPVEVFGNNEKLCENADIMPSGFFYADVKKDDSGNMTEVEFKGGGYGHGVGISLKRADILAEQGKSFQDIIKYFYSSVSVKNVL